MSRQARLLSRLANEGVTQTSVLVHEDCKPVLEALRPHLRSANGVAVLKEVQRSLEKATPVNVAQVRQLSPFRYPGGKTWLVPVAREWLRGFEERPASLLEPFAGGAMIGLTAAAERLVDHVTLVELDDDVSAVWECVFNGTDREFAELTKRILEFKVEEGRVREIINGTPRALHTRAFRTIVKNRTQRGGIMAPGAGLVRTGEGGRGLASRWYPETLVKRMHALRELRSVVTFRQGDAFDAIAADETSVLFVDPPYTAGGKRAGSRLYTHNEVDHLRLFDLVASRPGSAMLTYDNTEDVREMAAEVGFNIDEVPMKSTHHIVMRELVILKD